jgi:hypothetical protein
MFTHAASCLQGPITRGREWWALPGPDLPDPPRSDAPIRSELVERVRREIAAGTYDTPEKWEAALDRLLDRLEGE